MNTLSVINAPKLSPSVSLIVSTDKSYPQYKIHEEKLKSQLKNIEKDLIDNFSAGKAKIVIDKLQKLIDSIDHKHLSKGLAIYASPEREKIIYLPFAVKEKVIIDSSFEIRDLLYAAKNSIDYMILLINNHQPRIYYGYNQILVRIKNSHMPKGIEAVERDYASRVSNFSDPSTIKEISLDKYLREIDHVLKEELKIMNVPVIICGPQRSIGHFRNITQNEKHIADYIEGNHHFTSTKELYQLIEPSIIKKYQEAENSVLAKLEEALNKNEFACGIENVWQEAIEKRGKLLIVEKDFSFPARSENNWKTISASNIDPHDPDGIQDAVDDIIELVLKHGGNIAFVGNGKLETYKKIALITYY